MKRIMVFLIGLFFVSMVISANDGSSNNGTGINPPSWAIGTWEDKFFSTTHVVTHDNVRVITASDTIDFKEISKSQGTPVSALVDKDVYSLTISITYFGTRQSVSYVYTRLSDTTMKWTWTISGMEVGAGTLIKQ
ncbi:hypothetical protein Spico_0309 [Parasphaerochaeta coccoides DSM 17374]|uniref:DUF5640 domain-containing protein n=2 Tax=Parasphaerochaeta TaxID=3062336 RepID=F4GH64_PARC1|nr:hypothetical protein Spico_0309 [Parasphaerochaeta coccoides DSM 17374]